MFLFSDVLTSDICRRLALTMAHSLWQGFVVAAMLYVLLRSLSARLANLRYFLALGAMAMLTTASLGTWRVLAFMPINTATKAAPVASAVANTPDESPAHDPLIGVPTSPPAFATPKPSRPAPALAASDWSHWIAAAYLVGVICMLARTIRSVSGAGAIRRGARSLDNAETRAMVEQLSMVLRVGRRVVILLSDRIASPAVVGVLRPAILLPPAMLTGISPDQLQAILAHELAHIRRHDYLLNVLQMLVEAAGFFNPAVWWIGRQIRTEREACCDRAAVAVTGTPGALAEALATLAQLSPPVPAVGAGTGNLIDRLLRLDRPDRRPALRLRWTGVLSMLIVGAILGSMCHLAIGAAIDRVAVKRIAAVRKLWTSIKPEKQTSFDDGYVEGVVLTPDEKLYQDEVRIYEVPAGHYTSANWRKTGRFRVCIFEPGTYRLVARVKGFAAGISRPITVTQGETVRGVKIVLNEGFPGQLRILNERGDPITGATVWAGDKYCRQAGDDFETLDFTDFTGTTDTEGMVRIPRCSKVARIVRVSAPGYEYEMQKITFKANKPSQLILRPSKPFVIDVTDKQTGEPVARASIALLGRDGRRNIDHLMEPAGVTDSQGRFTAMNLNEKYWYYLTVTADGYARTVLCWVNSKNGRMNVKLGPPLRIRGKVLPLNMLGKDGLTYGYVMPGLNGGTARRSYAVEVTKRDGTGYFEINDLGPGHLQLLAGGKTLPVDLTESIDDLVFDLTARNERTVIIRFNVPEGSPALQGTVDLSFLADEPFTNVSEKKRIKNDRIEFVVPPPGKLQFNRMDIPGFLPIIPDNHIRIERDASPAEIVINCRPAGAIRVTARFPDRCKMPGIDEICFEASLTQTHDESLYEASSHQNRREAIDGRKATAVLSPLPVGYEFKVRGWWGDQMITSKPVQLSVENPIAEVSLEFTDGSRIRGIILNPDGKPAGNREVYLSRKSSPGHFLLDPFTWVQEDGRFEFTNVPLEPDQVYVLTVNTVRNDTEPWRPPIRFACPTNGDLITLTLPPLEQNNRFMGFFEVDDMPVLPAGTAPK